MVVDAINSYKDQQLSQQQRSSGRERHLSSHEARPRRGYAQLHDESARPLLKQVINFGSESDRVIYNRANFAAPLRTFLVKNGAAATMIENSKLFANHFSNMTTQECNDTAVVEFVSEVTPAGFLCGAMLLNWSRMYIKN